MIGRRELLLAILLAGLVPRTSSAAGFDLRFDKLLAPLTTLSAEDRTKVDRAIDLIRRGENLAAFAPLMDVVRANPANSSARVVLAYTMLQLGNLTGAFDHAKHAEQSPQANSYVCLFLARVAAIRGDVKTCHRELKHAAPDTTLAAEIEAVKRDLEKPKAR